MEIDAAAWTNLAIRWLHFVAGVSWIGASFYFVWLDNSLRAPQRPQPGVAGELWAVHGGGFYHNEKFLIAPAELPEHLHWFKWEAYTTWLSGFALLILIYYVGAETYLIDRSRMNLSHAGAVLVGLGALAGGWLIYDVLCRSPIGKNQAAFGAAWIAILTAVTFGLTRVFSDKGAFIHAGAIIGTTMAANVFFVIIPNQKKAVTAMIAGQAPDPALGATAKQRSVHNNYMTLPALLTMISGHYPQLVGHPFNWLLLAILAAASLMARHYFNLRHKGLERRELVAGAAGLFLATVLIAAIRPADAGGPSSANVSDLTISAIVVEHCVACHAAKPTNPAYPVAPNGLALESLEALRAHADMVRLQTVESELMPLGNQTGMTESERAALGAWLDEQEGGR